MSTTPDPHRFNPSQSPVAAGDSHQPAPFGLIRLVLVAFMAGILSGGSLIWFLARPAPPPIVLMPPPTVDPTPLPQPTPTPEPIVVFVSGEVTAPGIYRLDHQARVGDALAAAGGMTEEAAADLVNQAERLRDGVQLHVPRQVAPEEIAGLPQPPQPTPGLSGGSPAVAVQPVSLSSSNSGGRVNINTASLQELISLPGIGEVRANAIIAARPYASVQDLVRANGIGARTLESLLDLITVE
jgi:competence protein ComEA